MAAAKTLKHKEDSERIGQRLRASPAEAGMALAIGSIVVAALVLLLGWLGPVDQLVRLHPEYPAMVPETALCIVFGGVGVLWLFRPGMSRFTPWCGLLILALLLVARYAPITPDRALASDAMSWATTLCMLLLAGRLLLQLDRRGRAARAAVPMETVGLGVTMIPVLGYLFDAQLLFDNPVYTSMALHTALGLLALFAALLLADASRGWIAILLAPERGSEMARRVFPVVILVPVILCSIALIATRHEVVTADFRLAMLAFLMIAVTGVVLLYFAHVTNLSERRAARVEASLRESERLRQANELAAARSQKIEALGQLVGGVAHDFNNTLAVILGNLELLEAGPDATSREKYVKDAKTATRQGAHLTGQLLAYSRKSRLQPQQAVLEDIAATSLTMFRRISPDNIQVAAALGTTRLIVKLDVPAFQQALLNILINARDAMPDGGSITVSSAVENLAANTPVGGDSAEFLTAGNYVSVSVRDTGPGMSADTAARATEPYFTTKDVGEGSGLGLSMASGFCRQSGGALRIESQLGAGTTVSMVFPSE